MWTFRFQIVHDLVGIAGLLLVVLLLVLVHYIPILLTDYGPLSLSASRLFNAGITIVATLFTSLVSSRIQHSLMRSLEGRLRGLGEISGETDNHEGLERHVAMRRLDRQWRGVLGIDTVFEKPGNSLTFFTFLLCGLTTTAVVTALTPSVAEKAISYRPVVPDTDIGAYSNEPNRSCFGIVSFGVDTRSVYTWNFGNQTSYFAAADGPLCPPSSTMTLSAGINRENPNDYAYSVSGIGIERTAIGVPATIYKGLALANLTADYGTSLMSTTQCVPVMVSNPVRCEKGGEVEVENEHVMSVRAGSTVRGVSIQDSTFNGSGTFHYRFLNKDSTMISRLWPATVLNGKLWAADDYASPATDTIGPGLILFGVHNDPHGQTPYASYLAGTMSDPNKTVGTGGNETYTVTCVIDARNSFDYRMVSLDLRALDRRQNSTLARYVSGGERCTPVIPTISNKMFTTAVVASHTFATEGTGLSGYFATIQSLAGFYRGPPYAFPDSHNALEDVLGLISALGVSQIPLVGPGASADPENGSARAIVQVTRLGTDQRGVLVLLIPPLSSLVILVCLFVLSFREDWKPGGEEYRNKSWFQRPQRYAAESIWQLVNLRMRTSASFAEMLDMSKTGPTVSTVADFQGPHEAQIRVVPVK